MIRWFINLIILIIVTISCNSSYYRRSSSLSTLFIEGRYDEADAFLEKNVKWSKGGDKLLYYLNRGLISHFLKDYDKSNSFFEEAYKLSENYRVSYLKNSLSFITNSTVVDYTGEDHELLLLHYYKVLNFIHLNKFESALVECRRLEIKLAKLRDKYSKDSEYRRDAFVYNLMGIIYHASNDYNNAFIAYRNALEVYENDYKDFWQINIPEQLKADLLYCAYMSGLYDEYQFYLDKFGPNYKVVDDNLCELVCIWNNGLVPIKDDWGISFSIVRGANNDVYFINNDLDLFFAFPLGGEVGDDIFDLQFIKVSFPKYLEREPFYDEAKFIVGEKVFNLELIEDVNNVAFKLLSQRMVYEFSVSLLRCAIKKLTEHSIRKQNNLAGALIGGLNFFTEKADTRNWNLLPHSIYYSRIKLDPGKHNFSFVTKSSKNGFNKVYNDSVDLHNNHIFFLVFNSPYCLDAL